MKRLRKLTFRDRLAATECVRLMSLLAESGMANSQELALLVARRLEAITREGVGPPMAMENIEPWLEIGRQLQAQTVQPISQMEN